jgi:DNA repair and recombination RAD54-like protein
LFILLQVLGIIQSLSKLCNHPRLVYPSQSSGKKGAGGFDDTFKSCAHLFPDDFDIRGDARCHDGGARRMTRTPKVKTTSGSGGIMSELSGKMVVLDRLLCEMRKRGGERIVIVSNFTMTLDQITLLCRERYV